MPSEPETIGVLRTRPSEPIELHVGDRVLMRNKFGILCEYRVVRSLDREASTDDYADPPRLDPIKPSEEPDDE